MRSSLSLTASPLDHENLFLFFSLPFPPVLPSFLSSLSLSLSLPDTSLSFFLSTSKLPSGVAIPSDWDSLPHLQTSAVSGGRASVELPGAERKAPK